MSHSIAERFGIKPNTGRAVKHKLKPAELEFLLHCYIFGEPHPQEDAPTYKNAAQFFLREGIIANRSEEERVEHGGGGYSVTARGKAWLQLILNTPMPEAAWMDSEGKLIDTEAIP